MDNIYWNKKLETATRDELKKDQLKLLKEKVKFCYNNTNFYRSKFKSVGISPENIKTLEDIQKIPFTVKDDLRSNYPFGMLAVNLVDVVEIHASSGTTGNPVVGAYTTNDMDVWQELMARSLYTTGVRKEDVMHNAYGYGLFTGGLGFHFGAQKIGTTIIPVSGGMTQRQIKIMKDLGSTVLCCTPSYAVYLAETMTSEGIDPRKDLKLRIGLRYDLLEEQSLSYLATLDRILFCWTDHRNVSFFLNEVSNALNYWFFWTYYSEVNLVFVVLRKLAYFINIERGYYHMFLRSLEIERISLFVRYKEIH